LFSVFCAGRPCDLLSFPTRRSSDLVPHTGSTGDGYAWAIAAGHTVTELFPTEVPLTSDEPFIENRSLQGLSLRGVRLTVYNPKRSEEHTSELQSRENLVCRLLLEKK